MPPAAACVAASVNGMQKPLRPPVGGPPLGGLPVRARIALIVAAGYAVAACVSTWLLQIESVGAVFFPPAGITLAALVLVPRKYWATTLIAAGLTELAVDLGTGNTLWAAFGFAIANTVEPFLGAWLLLRGGPVGRLTSRRELGRFLGWAVITAPAVGAVLGTATIVAAQPVDVWATYLPYWAGDALGVLTVGGVLLSRPSDRDWLRRSTWAHYLAVLISSVLVTVVAFWPNQVELVYLVFPMLFLVAFRYGVPELAAAGLATTLTANLATGYGHGPWAPLARTPQPGIATLQIFLAIAVVSAWLLAVEIGARQRAQTRSAAETALRRRVQALQSVTEQLATAATSEQMAQIVVRDAIGLITPIGTVTVTRPDRSEPVSWLTAGYPDERPNRSVTGVPVGGQAMAAIRQRQPIRLGSAAPAGTAPPLPAHLRATGARGWLELPAVSADGVLGSLGFGFPDDQPPDPDTLSYAQALTQLTAQALERAQLYERDHEAAHQLQRALLPAPHVELPGLHAASVYLPADRAHEVGGDWYDAFLLPDRRIALVVGDVVGHDLAAAVAMGRLQAALRLLAAESTGPADLLSKLDTAVISIPNALPTTVGYAEYDPSSRELRYACAGHLPPLLASAEGVRYLNGGRSTPLGVPNGARPEAVRTLPPGATLFWCTDGLVERRGEVLDVGLNRLAAAAAGTDLLSAEAACARVVGELAGGPLGDDAVLLCVRTTDPARSDGTVERAPAAGLAQSAAWTTRPGPGGPPAPPS